MTDERSPEQQAVGLTEQSIGAENLIAEEFVDSSEQVSSLEVATPDDSSEEVSTTEVSSGDVSAPELSSDEIVTQKDDEVVAPEVSLEGQVDQLEPEIETVPLEEICNLCDPSDPFGLKSDPSCDLPLCKPEPEKAEENQDTLAEELPVSSLVPSPEDEGKSPEDSLEGQSGDVLEETEDLEDPCAVPEEPVCDFPKPAADDSGELAGQEINSSDLNEGMLDGSLPEGSPDDSLENPKSSGDETSDQDQELEVEIVVDPCGPRNPCGFQIDATCIVTEDSSLPPEVDGEPQKDGNIVTGEIQSEGSSDPQVDAELPTAATGASDVTGKDSQFLQPEIDDSLQKDAEVTPIPDDP